MRAARSILRGIHARFCAHVQIAEEMLPLRVFETFFTKHGEQASLSHQYPAANLVKDSLATELIAEYSTVLRGRTLPALAARCVAQFGHAIGRQVLFQAKWLSSLNTNGNSQIVICLDHKFWMFLFA